MDKTTDAISEEQVETSGDGLAIHIGLLEIAESLRDIAQALREVGQAINADMDDPVEQVETYLDGSRV